jgi:hypothetical protein
MMKVLALTKEEEMLKLLAVDVQGYIVTMAPGIGAAESLDMYGCLAGQRSHAILIAVDRKHALKRPQGGISQLYIA